MNPTTHYSLIIDDTDLMTARSLQDLLTWVQLAPDDVNCIISTQNIECIPEALKSKSLIILQGPPRAALPGLGQLAAHAVAPAQPF